jgi:F-type H+-transporting ATPase subunit epsilon
MTVKVNFVAADKRIWSGDAYMVTAPGEQGEFAVLEGHEPTMTLLKSGVVKISFCGDDGRNHDTIVQIEKGFLSLYGNEVSIVADSAEIQ